MIKLILIFSLLFSIGCSKNNNQVHVSTFEILRYAYATGCFQNSNLTKQECYSRALDYEKNILNH